MHQAIKAYAAVAKETASPRDLEAALLLKAASKLQSVHESWSDWPEGLDEALIYNRRLLTIFLDSVCSDDDPLLVETRQNIANLGAGRGLPGKTGRLRAFLPIAVHIGSHRGRCKRTQTRGVDRRPMRFQGTSAYVATDDLKVAVNAAITLERPLLVKGEPGTGKTVLALEIAKSLDAPLIEWHIKSTSKALQGLYEYDAVSRLRDSQLGDARVADIRNYIKRGKLWDAFVADPRPVLLIDEIDKADIEFPNDLLQELDRMEFFVYETGETIKARRRPITVITSNNEKELPDAFLRRCFFHYIRFPDPDTMRAIVEVHFPGIKHRLVAEALQLFYEVRDVPGLKKKPSTSELLDWLKLLLVEDMSPELLRERDPKKLIPPLHGALLKNEQDVHLFERLAFMARRESR
jgi:MoxR-like ATPase